MNADIFVKKGENHKFCEDYAISEVLYDDVAYCIVSDGCSSAPQTDIGSRILVHCAAQYLRHLLKRDCVYGGISLERKDLPELILNAVMASASNIAKQLGLDQNCLTCTLLIAIAQKNHEAETNIVKVIAYGDGAIFVRRNDLSKIAKILRYTSNAPFYPLFAYDPRLEFLYKSACDAIITPPQIGVTSIIDGDKSKAIKFENVQDIKQITSASSCCWQQFVFYDVDFVSIMSDGVESFRQIPTVGIKVKVIPTIDVIKEIVSYKRFNGEFVSRRMSFLQEWEQNDIFHGDDVSVASILL